MAGEIGACIICLDTTPQPIQSGCACRSDGGLAHIECRVQAAASQQAQLGHNVWRQCQSCKQDFTGVMRTGLAEAFRSRVAGQKSESVDWRAAELNLAQCFMSDCKHAQAELILRKLHEVETRVLGAEHPGTLATAGDLASSLSGQGKYADAQRVQREVLEVQKRVLGAENPVTLTTASNLATSLCYQGEYAEAEEIQREVLELERRVLGVEHPETLTASRNLASFLKRQGKLAEAEQLERALLATTKRVLGAEHRTR